MLFGSQKGTKKIKATWLKKAPPKAGGAEFIFALSFLT